MVEGLEGGAGEEVHVGGGLFPALQLAVMCVGRGGGRERGGRERGGGGLAVILRVVGEGAAYPLTHFFLPSDSRSCVGGEGWGGGSWRSKQV